ncbi:MAG: insulinase family protein [Acidobacteriaceae bacterium]|jgi:predicted Zn-dependent peptidase|nr:insulinase family protein [Acidobacteriaceae bacterium]
MSVNRQQLPVPGAARPLSFPSIHKTTLANGLGVWTVRHANIPVVTLALLVRGGAAQDGSGHEGLSALTIDMLDEGSGDRSAIDMHEALARVGAQLDSDIGADAAVLTVTALARFAQPALSLLADITVRPSLRPADVERVRQLRLHRLTQLRDVPGAVADRAFLRLLYGSHPYGHTPLGSEASLAALTPEAVVACHQRMLRPSESTLIVVGDCSHDEIVKLAADAFGDWSSAGRGGEVPMPEALVPPRLNIVPRAGAPQSELRIGQIGVPRNIPDYHALVAANMVLGGQFVSRINLKLREERGLTYGARTSFDFRRLPGPFSLQVSVQTSGTVEAIRESLHEIEAIRGSRPVTREELELGVAALTHGYARSFETAEQVARALTNIALYDLPDDYFVRFVPLVSAVTPGEVTRVMEKYLHPDRLTTLIVGDEAAIARDLDGLSLGAPNILSADTF